jgi:hypothetical membrane protein
MDSEKTAWLKISGVSGMLAPVVAFTFISLAILYHPQFSWTENALSDLGAVEGLTSALFNLGLIIAGILALLFGSGLLVLLRDNAVGRIGAFIFVLAALALTAIGVFPENVKPTHLYASLSFFALFPASMLAVGAAFWLSAKVKMGLFTFLAAAVAAVVWIIQWTIPFGPGVAIPETLSALSGSTWAIASGYKVLREASHSNK